MVFSDFNKEFVPRMKNPKPLNTDEVCDSMDWLSQTPAGVSGMLSARLAIQQCAALEENTQAIMQFERSSSRLNWWLIRLTIVLVILTIVIAGFTILLWKRD